MSSSQTSESQTSTAQTSTAQTSSSQASKSQMSTDQVSEQDEAVAAYLLAAPTAGQQAYARVRQEVIGQAGEERVSERLSYQMPTFFIGAPGKASAKSAKRLLHVGLWGEHLAIYPVPDSATDARLAADLDPHRKGKGTLHFPYEQEWPGELIARIVAAHLQRLA